MKIRLNIDSHTYTNKEKAKAHFGRIKNDVAAGSTEIEPKQLMQIIEQGRAFSPALMTGTDGDSWQSQQLLIADIDNDEDITTIDKETGKTIKLKDANGKVVKVALKKQLHSDQAAEICKAHNITPFLMYHTYSNGKTDISGVSIEKYRIVLLLDQPIESGSEAHNLTARFAQIFNEAAPGAADTSIKDNARVFLGSIRGSVFNITDSVTPLEIVRALPEIRAKEEATEERKPATYKQPISSGIYDDLKRQRRDDIENIDLENYVLIDNPRASVHYVGKQKYINPCPICGHNDDFSINGYTWQCFSDSTDDKTGGTIIDYLMFKEKKTLQEALKKFDTEIMRYEMPETATTAESTTGTIKTAENENNADIEPKEKAETLDKYNAHTLLTAFIENSTLETPCIKTGFNIFDNETDGGLYPGLYILGAISSMGKTSFMLQLADQLATGKNDVLYFTLEMGSSELIAKSLSRYSYIAAEKNADDAVYTRTITNAQKRAEMTVNQRINYDQALDEYYKSVSKNLWYFESVGDIGIDEIKERVKKHYEITGHTPIVFIDYLQILKPFNDTWTEKRNTDKAVLELRKLAREYNTTIFVISSLNRSSYKGDISMDAFKESGAIEYGSDVLLGLQPRGMAAGSLKKDEKKNIELVEDTKAAENRELELKVLKNRTGRTGQRINFEYNAKFNYFAEEVAPEFGPAWEPAKGVNDVF